MVGVGRAQYWGVRKEWCSGHQEGCGIRRAQKLLMQISSGKVQRYWSLPANISHLPTLYPWICERASGDGCAISIKSTWACSAKSPIPPKLFRRLIPARSGDCLCSLELGEFAHVPLWNKDWVSNSGMSSWSTCSLSTACNLRFANPRHRPYHF